MTPSSTSLERALLGLLRQKPQSGYDLRKLFATTPVRHFSDSPGSIYPALRRLQARGWILTKPARATARQRQEFRLTNEGKRALVEWLRQPVTRDDVIWRLEDVLLRFAFLDGNVDREVALRFLTDLERELVAYIGELERYSRETGLLKTLSTGGLAFANGLHEYKFQLSWARSARRKLMEVSS